MLDRRTTTAPPGNAPTTSGWATLGVLCLVQFMLTFDDTAVNVAIPQLQTDLGFSTASVAWVANAYFVTFGGLLLLGGRLGDVFGRRRVFLVGLAVFGVASIASGLAQSPSQLIAGRFLQGAAAAMVSPSALALIAVRFPGEQERSRAFSVWGAVAGAGGVSGLILAGLLIDAGSWRWIFLVNPPIVLLGLVLVPVLTAESRDPEHPSLDTAGAVLATAAVTSMIHGLLAAADHGWSRPGTTIPIAVSLALASAFVAVERRASHPLVPLTFVSYRPRLTANVVNLVFAAAFFSLSFLLMLHLQRVLGYTALRAAAAYLPHGLALLAGVAVSSRAAARIGVRATVIVAMSVGAVGMAALGVMAGGNGYTDDLLPGLVVTGFASGLGFPVLAVAALVGTDDRDAGLGSALLSSSQQLGGAIGLAVLVNVAASSSGLADERTLRALGDGISNALIAVGIVLAGGALVATRLSPASQGDPSDPSDQTSRSGPGSSPTN